MYEHRENAPPLNELIGDTVRHGADLVRSEMSLLRAELADNIRQVAMGVAMFVLSAVFLVIAVGLAVDALVAWLTPLLGSPGAAAIACSAGAAVIAFALAAFGLFRVRSASFYPERTVASVERDARMIKQRVS